MVNLVIQIVVKVKINVFLCFFVLPEKDFVNDMKVFINLSSTSFLLYSNAFRFCYKDSVATVCMSSNKRYF